MRYLLILPVCVAFALFAATGCNPSTTVSEPTVDRSIPAESTEVTTVDFANAKCPIMGGKPAAELTAQYEGKTIGFCCEGCPEKWAELSDQQKAEKFADVRIDANHG